MQIRIWKWIGRRVGKCGENKDRSDNFFPPSAWLEPEVNTVTSTPRADRTILPEHPFTEDTLMWKWVAGSNAMDFDIACHLAAFIGRDRSSTYILNQRCRSWEILPHLCISGINPDCSRRHTFCTPINILENGKVGSSRVNSTPARSSSSRRPAIDFSRFPRSYMAITQGRRTGSPLSWPSNGCAPHIGSRVSTPKPPT